MAEVRMHIPVFLPGNNRDWKEIQGMATITDEGEINITLDRKQAGLKLFEMLKEGTLVQLSFDYREVALPTEDRRVPPVPKVEFEAPDE